MNEYKITYLVNGRPFTVNRIERTEATARRSILKEFKAGGSHTDVEVTDIELLRDNACATKAQERETLEAIRKMVAELGPQSYVATAFEGCFEDAEQNIECDFAFSQKQVADAATEKVAELEAKVKELEGKLKTSELNERDLRSAIAKAKADASKTISDLQLRQLSDEDLERVVSVLSDRASEAEEMAEKEAAEIVRLADDPASPEFHRAVSMHRNHSTYAGSLRELLGRVDAIRANNHAGA